MQQIIDFIIRKKDVVVYFILLSLSLALILNSNYFQKSKVLLLSNNISNYTKENLNFFNEYFKLKEVNFQLSEENLDLKNKLEKTNINTGLDSLRNLNFSYKNAKVISNNLSSFKNKIIIEYQEECKGRQGVLRRRGKINKKGHDEFSDEDKDIFYELAKFNQLKIWENTSEDEQNKELKNFLKNNKN